jgi:hypothetical protein
MTLLEMCGMPGAREFDIDGGKLLDGSVDLMRSSQNPFADCGRERLIRVFEVLPSLK